MKINPKYQGTDSRAITTFKGDYVVYPAFTPEELKERIQKDTKLFGPDFIVVRIYDNVGPAAEQPLNQAADDLRKGKEVDLDRILE